MKQVVALLKIAFFLRSQTAVKTDLRLVSSTLLGLSITLLQSLYMYFNLLNINLQMQSAGNVVMLDTSNPRAALIVSLVTDFFTNSIIRIIFALAAVLIGAVILKLFGWKFLTFKEAIKLSNANVIPIWIASNFSIWINWAFMETVIGLAIVRGIVLMLQNRNSKPVDVTPSAAIPPAVQAGNNNSEVQQVENSPTSV